MKRFGVALTLLFVTGAVALFTGRTLPAQAQQSAGASHETRLWNWLQGVKYHNWAPGPGQNGDFYPGESPHGAFLKMYVNRTAACDPANMPFGSIIVKENYGEDEETLMAITVMQRSEGYDAEHMDWYYVKYMPDGTVAETPPEMGSMPVAGRFPMCLECHSGAAGEDYVFANDE